MFNTAINLTALATISLGSYLLFTVQPLLGKLLLPVYGGAAATWLTCLFFFQLVLLCGYGYSYLNDRYLSSRTQKILHITLALFSIVQLPIALDPSYALSPTLNILLSLAGGILLPYFILSSNLSTIQSWSRNRFSDRGTLAWIYGISNLASFAALLSYPFLIEPRLGLRAQSDYWSTGYQVYIGATLFIAILTNFGETQTPPKRSTAPSAISTASIALWLLLAFLGNGLLIAATNKLTQDIAAVPFLWILPLTMYLLSFVLAFSLPAANIRSIWLLNFTAAIAILVDPTFISGLGIPGVGLLPALVGATGWFVLSGCMLVHGELYRRKPTNTQLPFFYLILAFSGPLASLFCSILPAAIFNDLHEFDLLLAAIPLTVLAIKFQEDGTFRRHRLFACSALSILICSALIYIFSVNHANNQIAGRNFFGVLKISENSKNSLPTKVLQHGHVVHGMQLLDPRREQEPTTYYCPETLAGTALLSSQVQPRNIAVVGLGAGTIATYGRAGDQITFYEINPLVLQFAEHNFSFLQNSAAKVRTVIGDARTSLSQEQRAEERYDILIIDAFSGDSIPSHLLTVEAFQLYLSRLKDDGILILHLSNLYLDLLPLALSLAETLGISITSATTPGNGELCYAAIYAAMARQPESLVRYLGDLPPPDPAQQRIKPWTDDYSNLFDSLRR